MWYVVIYLAGVATGMLIIALILIFTDVYAEKKQS
jgi:hypothetical protein